MTRDDLLDMLPRAVYLRDGTLVICTYHERLLKAGGIDIDLLWTCVEDNATDDEIYYHEAVNDYCREKEKPS